MFYALPLELKTQQRKAAFPTANVALVIANVLVYALNCLWYVGPNTRLPSVLMYGFSHINAWHLLFNMWLLLVFGNPVNRRLGNGCYLLAYLSTITGLGLFIQLFTNVVACGASGGVYAVIAIALLLMPRARLRIGYLVLFPLTVLVGLFRQPNHVVGWLVRWGIWSPRAVWFLAIIPVIELWWLSRHGLSSGNLIHLLGMLCGLAVVLMLPERISMPVRNRASAGWHGYASGPYNVF